MDLSSLIAPGALGSVIIAALAVALLARVEYLNSSFRLRKRLKEEMDLADKLPGNEDKEELLRLINLDLKRYNLSRNPERKRNRRMYWRPLVAMALTLGGYFISDFGSLVGITDPVSQNITYFLIFLSALLLLSSLSGVWKRQGEIRRELADLKEEARDLQNRSRENR
ncbi:hypothetical protein HDC34_001914 [Pseudoclavibacter sp. JAI123]|uniref:hypothetical protein n=1 Tax=Pseudoclavibacter sp. JAI123 TaxID=2723065 RepID=UPI0015C722D6|nr:hypothetical protein [Pseudoclavibacter sp. JAI123]NYF13620.1 hypothetical protein [Pseudoclavibacter sp. JAI123]